MMSETEDFQYPCDWKWGWPPLGTELIQSCLTCRKKGSAKAGNLERKSRKANDLTQSNHARARMDATNDDVPIKWKNEKCPNIFYDPYC